MQFFGRLTIQTSENGKKLNFGSGFGSFGLNLGTPNSFVNSISTFYF